MKILFRVLLLVLVCNTLNNCTDTNNRYTKIINYVIQDSTLADSLMYEGHPEDYKLVKAGDFEYSVHSLMNSSLLDYEHSQCIGRIENSSEVIKEITSSLNNHEPEIVKYSSADSANVHLFFTNSVGDVQGVTVFYRNLDSYDNLYSKPLDFIWRYNRGVFYLFTFHKKTGKIENVCKEIVLNE